MSVLHPHILPAALNDLQYLKLMIQQNGWPGHGEQQLFRDIGRVQLFLQGISLLDTFCLVGEKFPNMFKAGYMEISFLEYCLFLEYIFHFLSSRL